MSDKNRNWFARHKILTVILAFVVIGVLASAAGGGGNSSPSSSSGNSSGETKDSGNSAKTYRFADRADKQPKDVELLPAESGAVSGVKLTVASVQYTTSLSEYEKAEAGKSYLIADVQLENTSDRTQPYNALDFRIQTAGGQVLDSTFAGSMTTLNSGDLVAGGKAAGKVLFQVPTEDGHQYLIWKPGFGSERAIVQTK